MKTFNCKRRFVLWAPNKLVRYLDKSEFEKDEEKRTVLLNEKGLEKIEDLLKKEGLIKNGTLQHLDNIGLSKNDINIIVSQTPKERLEPVPFELSPQKFEQIISTMYKN